MKQTLTVEVDADLVTAAERLASQRGVTLSELVEQALREAVGAPKQTFSEWVDEWHEKYPLREDIQYTDEDIDRLKWEHLSEKYLR